MKLMTTVIRRKWPREDAVFSLAVIAARRLDRPTTIMSKPQEQNFDDYKKAEAKALELLGEMKQTSAKKVDIELALLVALFELHKGTLPARTVGKIIEGHLGTLIPYYEESSDPSN